MKLLYLIYTDIKSFVLNDKRIFILLFTGLAVSAFSLTFLILFTMNTQNRLQSYDEYKTRQYNISFSEVESSQKYNLLNKILQIKDVAEIDEIFITAKIITKNDTINLIGFHSDRELFYVSQGKKFNSISSDSSDNIAIMSNDLLDYTKKLSYINDEYMIQNDTFNIVSIYEGGPPRSILIPYYTFTKLKYDFSDISITYSKMLGTNKETRLTDNIHHLDPSLKVQCPSEEDISNQTAYYIKMVIYILLIGSSILTVMTMLKYLNIKNRRQYAIYLLCGAKRKLTYLIINTEALFISFFAFLIGFGFYKIVSPFLGKYDIDVAITYNQFTLIFVIYTLCIILSIQSSAIKITRQLSIHSLL